MPPDDFLLQLPAIGIGHLPGALLRDLIGLTEGDAPFKEQLEDGAHGIGSGFCDDEVSLFHAFQFIRRHERTLNHLQGLAGIVFAVVYGTNGIIPNVALKYDKDERLYAIDYEEAEISEEERNSTKPEDIQKCIKAGVLPTCYENTPIEVEIQEQSVLSCFTLNEDGTVTCPMGKILSRTKKKGRDSIYANKDACRQCPNKCTASKKYKTVSFGPDTKYIPVRMYGDVKCKLNPIPENAVINPFNHTLDRKDYMPSKKVVLKIKKDIHKEKLRMCLSEHPFGTVKWHHGAHYLLCKGKEKVTAEIALSFLAYNMKRAINIAGIQKLLAAF